MKFIVTPERFGDRVEVKLDDSTKRKIQRNLVIGGSVGFYVYALVRRRKNLPITPK